MSVLREQPSDVYDQNYNSSLCGQGQCGIGNTTLMNMYASSTALYQAASVPFALSAIDPQEFQ